MSLNEGSIGKVCGAIHVDTHNVYLFLANKSS